MARKRRRQNLQTGELNLTAMIDVAFQLLSFFLITSQPVDVMAHLGVSSVAPDPHHPDREPPVFAVRINVQTDGRVAINGRTLDMENIDSIMTDMGTLSTDQTVLVTCAPMSLHSKLIHILDVCAKAGFTNVALVSGK